MTEPSRVRAMEAGDVPQVVDVSAAAFDHEISQPSLRADWERRIVHPFDSDPDGAFVAERDGRIVGVAQAMRRERLWVLSLLTVDPGGQGTGAGHALMEAAMTHRQAGDAGLIVSSNDARALRLYGRAGFRLIPTFEARGTLDRSRLPAGLPTLRDGAGDLEALAAISRAVRGAPHTRELPHALERGAQLLRLGDRGFAVAQRGHGVWLLVAHDDAAATALLWQALELVGDCPRPVVRWLTGEQQWAIELLLAAGFGLAAYGALCVGGTPGTLRPFIPSGPFA